MNSDHVLDKLNEYLDGHLTGDELASLERHLIGCGDCRAELEALRSLLRKAAGMPREIQPPHELWEGIARRIKDSPRRQEKVLDFKPKDTAKLPRTRTVRILRFAAAIAAVFATVTVGTWWFRELTQSGWNVASLEGKPRLGGTVLSGEGRIRVGEVLETDAASRATIEVGHIGRVSVDPNTRIRLIEATLSDHRLALDEGTIHANIFAPPRLFFVETPSALAVDLGCAYTLRVDSTGSSVLSVTSGWVSLEFHDRESIVPAGAMCITQPGRGPGTPFQEDASEKLKSALTAYDFENGGKECLATILASARNMDSITLWHLLIRTAGEDRARVYDRLAALVPPPSGVTREGMLAGDPEMISRWQKHINLGVKAWWKVWQ